ncbi:MAG: hypothetical protein HYS18_03020 [Burkholderiales bacterium]|nr:hypothetical protein [Burkholderiales bacterium]
MTRAVVDVVDVVDVELELVVVNNSDVRKVVVVVEVEVDVTKNLDVLVVVDADVVLVDGEVVDVDDRRKLFPPLPDAAPEHVTPIAACSRGDKLHGSTGAVLRGAVEAVEAVRSVGAVRGASVVDVVLVVLLGVRVVEVVVDEAALVRFAAEAGGLPMTTSVADASPLHTASREEERDARMIYVPGAPLMTSDSYLGNGPGTSV